jgi:hypothetical protein
MLHEEYDREQRGRKGYWARQFERQIDHLGGRASSLSPITSWEAEGGEVTYPEKRHLEWEEERARRKSFPRCPSSSPRSTVHDEEFQENVAAAKPIDSLNDIDLDDTLCNICRGINAEVIESETGYPHRLLADLEESSANCQLCLFLRHHFGEPEFPWSNRFRVVLRHQWAEIIDTETNMTHKGRSVKMWLPMMRSFVPTTAY